ncbi:MAG: L-seryl-tRNA(Sec) selenium transferase [Chloroflexi bacterium]|nr:L-seryl-tRNA(Sec) selenium transferase [Chloroflexota bacterium]
MVEDAGRVIDERFRSLPSVDRLLRAPRVAALVEQHSRALVVEELRALLDDARAGLKDGGEAPSADAVVAALERRLPSSTQTTLRRAINATGVVIHTNLGRAPLSEAAMAAMLEVARDYSNLEYDLDAGARGSRHEHADALLRRLTGAESSLVVNNNAAAILLALITFAQGREVVIGRGELVEIGGGFRIPDVLRQSGARLVEVGTTNRTYAADYAAAVGPEASMLLRVHPSNFQVVGFVHRPTMGQLAKTAHERGVLLVDDLGSGSLLDTSRYGLAREPMVQESIADGADLVCFSGDKLLGGPQCGILLGRAELIGKLKRHPLTRAIRPDKLTLAALGATLGHYLRGEATRTVPVWRMIAAQPAEIELRALALRDELADVKLETTLLDGRSAIGGGSLPGETLPTRLLGLRGDESPDRLAARLRAAGPAVVARVERDWLVLDLRTVLPEQDGTLAGVLRAALGADRATT